MKQFEFQIFLSGHPQPLFRPNLSRFIGTKIQIYNILKMGKIIHPVSSEEIRTQKLSITSLLP